MRSTILHFWLFACCMSIAYCYAEEQTPSYFNYPIDIVYLWVDGSDPAWQVIKDYYIKRAAADAHTANRFADNEELRYSLRSILEYAPFVNHIYIVTMNQRPSWLADHPMITIIDHTQIFKDLNDLPTFNSQAIECNLHRIPNLLEHFIYFNDDVFLGAPVSPLDFFTSDGTPKVLFEKSPSPSGPPLEHETAYRRAWRNTNAFLDAQFKKETRYRLAHAPFALRKSFIEEVEQAVPHIFASNSSHKFRSDLDYNMTNGFLQYYWSYSNRIERGSMGNAMISIYNDRVINKTQKLLHQLLESRLETFCLQDVMEGESIKTKKLLHEFLESYYPKPAPWEKK